MNAIANKYTEESYLTHEELKEKFLPAQMESIWKEIMKYRELFVIEFPSQAYIVHSIAIQKQHASLEQKLNRIIRECPREVPSLGNGFGVSAEVESVLKRRYYKNFSCTLKSIYHDLLLEYHEEVQYLDDHSLPTFVRLFYIMVQFVGEERKLLIRHMSYELHFEFLSTIVGHFELSQSEFDLTKAYLRWLLDINSRMVEFYQLAVKKQDAAFLSEYKLIEKYPQLKEYQAEFFETHRSLDSYYTVEQFSLFCNTCYETARISMEEFVRLGWYKKEKCGKKFVYYIG